jgi:hypothetical protein
MHHIEECPLVVLLLKYVGLRVINTPSLSNNGVSTMIFFIPTYWILLWLNFFTLVALFFTHKQEIFSISFSQRGYIPSFKYLTWTPRLGHTLLPTSSCLIVTGIFLWSNQRSNHRCPNGISGFSCSGESSDGRL